MKTYWRVTLVSGEVIDDERCYHCYNGELFRLNEYIAITKKYTKGMWWWKKEVEEEDNILQTLYIIPKEQIRKVELMKGNPPHEV